MHERLDQVRAQIQRPSDKIIQGAWFIAGPEWTHDPMLVVTQEPIRAVLVRLRTALIVLPWPSGPADFYTEAGKHFADGARLQLQGKALAWPTTMVMAMDFHATI